MAVSLVSISVDLPVHAYIMNLDKRFLVLLITCRYIYLGRFIRKLAKKQLKRNKADKNINTRRLCGENNITNKKKYLICTAKRSHNNRKKKEEKFTLMSDQN